MNTKALSKTAQIKADRAARKQTKAAEKAKKAANLEYLLRRAQELSVRIPPEYQEWGATKTEAFFRLCAITQRRAALKHPKLDVLSQCVGELESHSTWTLERCAQLALTPETSVNI